MPAGLRVAERVLAEAFGASNVIACYPEDLPKHIGPRTRAVGVSTHNPLGATFAAGVFASVFGTSKEPITSHYTRLLFDTLKVNPYRSGLKVIVGGTGSWRIVQTNAFDQLGIDCVLEGRSETPETLSLFHKAIAGEPPRDCCGGPPWSSREHCPARQTDHVRRG